MLFSPKMLLSTPSVWGAALGIFGSIGYLGRFRRSALVIERLYGLKVGSFLETLTSRGTVTLAYTSALFQPEASTFDRSVHFVGPMITPRHDASNFPFDHLSGDPLVYVSLGTTINNHPAFFKLCLEAFAGQPYQVVMSIGDRVAVDQLGEIPANVLIRPSVPQLEILQRARVFISHSGMNSVQESLYYGVPMLLVPQQTEQDLTANRVAELGAGIKVKLPIKPEKLLALTERLITNPTFRIRADVVGDSLLKAGGASRAADDLIALLNRSVTA
jgi:MGT family glycosyltransferase